MKIGTCIIFTHMEGLEDKFRVLHENGFDSCQLLSWNPAVWTDENAKVVKGFMEKYQIIVTAFWCGWQGPCYFDFYEGQLTIGLVPTAYRQMRVNNLRDGADFAHKLGVTDVVTHMGYIPENPYDPDFNGFCIAARTVARHLKRNGQYLLFETGQETPTTLLRSFEQIGMDNLGVNLDTGNLIRYGKGNPVDALDTIGQYVRNIHAKDGFYPTDGKKLGKEASAGEGKVDFRALFKKLHELGYNTYVTIENELYAETEIQPIVKTRDYLQSIIDEIYCEK